MTSEPSGRLYSAVTNHWPRIATGLVVVLGIVELVAGGLTADSGVEFYLMAWAGTTGGLWFLFEKAETALSEESRFSVASLVRRADLKSAFASIPSQFAVGFDYVFGDKHWSRSCFYRSAAASILAASLSVVVIAALGVGVVQEAVVQWLASVGAPSLTFGERAALSIDQPMQFLAVAVALNVLPDYAALLETRWVIGFMEQRKNLVALLLFDGLLTAAMSLGFITAIAVATTGAPWSPSEIVLGEHTYSPFFYSAFATSVWLWLYAASVLVSRLLLKMNSGVGFLLRVTDVERQPFRSMGFVSVIIVSVLFALGLPLVLV